MRHGAKEKRCISDGCTNHAKRGEVCRKHGAYCNTNDESTAFRSEYEKTTATQALPDHRASRAVVRWQVRRKVP